jgi:hypothetical protein
MVFKKVARAASEAIFGVGEGFILRGPKSYPQKEISTKRGTDEACIEFHGHLDVKVDEQNNQFSRIIENNSQLNFVYW